MFPIIRRRVQFSSLRALEQFYKGSTIMRDVKSNEIPDVPLTWSPASIVEKLSSMTDSPIEEFPSSSEVTFLIQNDRSSRERGAIANTFLQEMKKISLKPIVDGLSKENDWVIIVENGISIHLCTSKIIEENNLREIFTHKKEFFSEEIFFKEFISGIPKSILKKPINHP